MRVSAVLVGVVVALAAYPSISEAVALRPNKATDDSVCDLTHHTNRFLGSLMLVPAVASTKDKTDAYFRLGAEFVGGNCRNGQVLMVQGSSSSSVDVQSLTELANSACTVASITRSNVEISFANFTEPGFELRCTISKLEELTDKLTKLEAADPMSALKARMYEAVRRAEGSAPSGSDDAPKRDCTKVTLATLLGGGSCR